MFTLKKFLKFFNLNKNIKILIPPPVYRMNSSENIFFEYLSNGDVSYCEKMFNEGFKINHDFRQLLEYESRILFETSLLSVSGPHPIANFSEFNFFKMQEKKILNKNNESQWDVSTQRNAGVFLRFLLGKEIYSKNMLDLLGKDIALFTKKDHKILNSENKEDILEIGQKYENTPLGIINRRTNNDFLFYGNRNNIYLIGFEKPRFAQKPSKELINYIHDLKKKKRYKDENEEPSLIQNLKNESYLYHFSLNDIHMTETLLNRRITFKNIILQNMITGEVSLELNKKRQRDVVAIFFVKDLIHSLIKKNEVTHAQIFEENIDNRPGLRGLALFALLDNFKEVAPFVTEDRIKKLSNIPLFNSALFEVAYKALLNNKKQNNLKNIRDEIQKNNLNNNTDFSILTVLENMDVPLEIKNKVSSIINKLSDENIRNIQDKDIKSMIKNIKNNVEDVIMNYSTINQVVDTSKITNHILDILKKSEFEIEKIEKNISISAVKQLQVDKKISQRHGA